MISPCQIINNAYCTCTAGLLASCNHVVGLLLRIEAAIMLGHSHQTCTSQLSQRNIPSQKKQTEPGEVANFIFEKGTHKEGNLADSKREKAENKIENEFPGGIRLSS